MKKEIDLEERKANNRQFVRNVMSLHLGGVFEHAFGDSVLVATKGLASPERTLEELVKELKGPLRRIALGRLAEIGKSDQVRMEIGIVSDGSFTNELPNTFEPDKRNRDVAFIILKK